jgi:hypothetical protein
MAHSGPDAALVRRIADGDGAEDALTSLFRAHGPAVYGYALRVAGARPAAERLTVDTFLWLAGPGAREYDPERTSVRAHLIARVHRDGKGDAPPRSADQAASLAVHGGLDHTEVAVVLGVDDERAKTLLRASLGAAYAPEES